VKQIAAVQPNTSPHPTPRPARDPRVAEEFSAALALAADPVQACLALPIPPPVAEPPVEDKAPASTVLAPPVELPQSPHADMPAPPPAAPVPTVPVSADVVTVPMETKPMQEAAAPMPAEVAPALPQIETVLPQPVAMLPQSEAVSTTPEAITPPAVSVPQPEALSAAPPAPLPATVPAAQPLHAGVALQVVVIQPEAPVVPPTPAVPVAQLAQVLPPTPAVVHIETPPMPVDAATEAVLTGHAPAVHAPLVQAAAASTEAHTDTPQEERDPEPETSATLTTATRAEARPAPAPAVVEPSRLIEQIANAVRLKAHTPQQQITVQLAPASLGLLRIRVSTRGGEITAHVDVDDPAVHAALDEHTHALRQALSEVGLVIDTCTFSLGTGTGERAETPFQAPAPRSTLPAAPRTAPPVPAPLTRRAAQGAVLDCFV
jgi:hypothetical protein